MTTLRSSLQGFVVGVTAGRRASEQVTMFERRGARVVHGPVLQTQTLPATIVEPATRALIAEPPGVTVLSTGVGVRAWFDAADELGLADHLQRALARSFIIARGPKAAGAARTVGLPVDWIPATARSDEILLHWQVAGWSGHRVALQRDGDEADPLALRLRAAGAQVLSVPVYQWDRPDDLRPAARLIDAIAERRVDAVTFTAAPQVAHLASIADGLGRRSALEAAWRSGTVLACIGPVCADAARDLGWTDAMSPARPRLGALVAMVADALVGQVREVSLEEGRVLLRGRRLDAGGGSVELTDRDRRIFGLLAERPGAVVSKARLLRDVWGDPNGDEHAVEVAVGRLRRRLSPTGLTVTTVVRRGYRLVRTDA